MSLDFYITEYMSQGDVSAEGNAIAAWWWNMTGIFRHIDIPLWTVYVFGVALFLHMKSEFFALWWLNGLAFGHLIGVVSWLPYGILDFFYAAVKNELVLTFTLSGLGMFLGLLFAFVQIRVLGRLWTRKTPSVISR